MYITAFHDSLTKELLQSPLRDKNEADKGGICILSCNLGSFTHN